MGKHGRFPAPAAATASPHEERLYRVSRACRVPDGGAYYNLAEGQIISSRGHDVDHLMAIGVPLEQVADRNGARRAILL